MEDKDWIFKKLPNWLRWILALPVGLIYSLIIPSIVRFASNWTYGDTSGIPIFDTFIMISSAAGLVIGIYTCVPRFKNQIAGVISIILAMYFAVIVTLFVIRGFSFWEYISNIGGAIASICMAYINLRNRTEPTNEEQSSSI